MESGDIAPLIHNLDDGEWLASHPERFNPEKELPVPAERDVGFASGPVWRLRRRYFCLASYCLVSKPALLTDQSLYIQTKAVQ